MPYYMRNGDATSYIDVEILCALFYQIVRFGHVTVRWEQKQPRLEDRF